MSNSFLKNLQFEKNELKHVCHPAAFPRSPALHSTQTLLPPAASLPDLEKSVQCGSPNLWVYAVWKRRSGGRHNDSGFFCLCYNRFCTSLHRFKADKITSFWTDPGTDAKRFDFSGQHGIDASNFGGSVPRALPYVHVRRPYFLNTVYVSTVDFVMANRLYGHLL